jgi:hypothetical protein
MYFLYSLLTFAVFVVVAVVAVRHESRCATIWLPADRLNLDGDESIWIHAVWWANKRASCRFETPRLRLYLDDHRDSRLRNLIDRQIFFSLIGLSSCGRTFGIEAAPVIRWKPRSGRNRCASVACGVRSVLFNGEFFRISRYHLASSPREDIDRFMQRRGWLAG